MDLRPSFRDTGPALELAGEHTGVHVKSGQSGAAGFLRIEPYPFGKTFAVVLTDDTDGARLETLTPIYCTLDEYDIRVTKTVWPLPAVSSSGSLPPAPWDWDTVTLQDCCEYQRFCQDLQQRGHEIAMHTASGGDNVRERTLEAYRLFERVLGHPPRTNIMHGRNRENLYWGRNLFPNPVMRSMVGVFEPQDFHGHDPTSPYFWGDICRERTTYVRMLETRSLNTLAFDPATPFHDPTKPYVNWWFSATYGGPRAFRNLFTPESI
ncbi:MAG: hypothetical protein LC799_13180, partial [Actinobacteria bacterium]|nr:hypothetical protein [Actinomycetota bacterium]